MMLVMKVNSHRTEADYWMYFGIFFAILLVFGVLISDFFSYISYKSEQRLLKKYADEENQSK